MHVKFPVSDPSTMIFISLFSQLTRSKLLIPGIEEEQSLREQGSGVGVLTLHPENFALKPKSFCLRTDIDPCECAGHTLLRAWGCLQNLDLVGGTCTEVDTSLLFQA
jgi:hypothetical protein